MTTTKNLALGRPSNPIPADTQYYVCTYVNPDKNALPGATFLLENLPYKDGNVTAITFDTPYTLQAQPPHGYAFDSWSVSNSTAVSVADTTSPSTTVTFHQNGNSGCVGNLTVYYDPEITITSSPPGGGLVSIDGGDPQTTPVTFDDWRPGDTHALSADPECGAGCQSTWLSWNDMGLQSHNITVPETPTTYTAVFKIQYQLIITLNGHGVPTPSSGTWYDPGASVTVTIGSDGTNSSNTRFLINAITGSGGGSYTGSLNPFSLTMNAPITESIAWTKQYTITINLNGHGASTPASGSWENSGTIVPVTIGSDGTNSSSIRNIIRTITGTGSGSFTGLINPFTVTMNAPIVETVTWATQYMLNVEVNPSGGGTVTPSSGWQNPGASITLTANDATGYAFSSWNGTGNGAYSGFNDPAIVKMNGPVNETANFHSLIAITLTSGWNLISLPIVPNSTSIASLLRSQIKSNEVVSVWSYSASSKSWHVFTPGKPSTLTTMTDGNGYWIYMRTADTLYVGGYVVPPGATPPTYQLNAGWNLVGFKPQPLVASETVGQYLASINGKYVANSVWVHDNASGQWIRADSTYTLQLGQAMWILITAPATLKP